MSSFSTLSGGLRAYSRSAAIRGSLRVETKANVSLSLHPTTRSFSSTSINRTTSALANILANDPSQAQPLSIDKFTSRGFHLTDDLVVPGGLILLEGKPFLWDVDPPKVGSGSMLEWWTGWTRERLEILETVLPRPEILLFGTGEQSIPVPKDIRDYISSLGIQLDVMDSRNAASTFNLLQEEGRRVAAALCPLKPIDPKTGDRR